MPDLERHTVLGMAGHIDHGKTEIVKALTGTDTDRLKEEKERGMTTDLGFAFLGDRITIIDVPGHEKFVKTMVAGVNTVDLALLVVAADDGIMPQTVEHLEILNLLQIPLGIVVINKIDLVENSWLEMVREDVKKLIKGTVMEHAPIVPVSPVTGENMDLLKKTILDLSAKVHEKKDKGVFRMPIDRIFTIKGFGTVVAGTVLSGTLSPEDTVELLPQGILSRVRGVQVHDRTVQESRVGFRTAVNLMGIEKEIIQRGHTLAEPGFFKATQMINAHFHLLKTFKKELKNRSRVHIHIGTDEGIARIIILDRNTLSPGEQAFVQLHFEKPMVTDSGDRYVVRSYSPVRTIGGGTVLEVHPPKYRRFQKDVLDSLERLMKGEPAGSVRELLERTRFQPMGANEIARALGIHLDQVQSYLNLLTEKGEAVKMKDRWMSRANLEHLKVKIESLLGAYHEQNPLKWGISSAELLSHIRPPSERSVFDETVKQLGNEGKVVTEKNRLKLKTHIPQLSPALENVKKEILERLLADPISPPGPGALKDALGPDVDAVLSFMIESGELIRLEEGILLHRKAVDKATAQVTAYLKERGEATVSDLKQLLGTTRKYAVPLLAYLDSIGVTERCGDQRSLKE